MSITRRAVLLASALANAPRARAETTPIRIGQVAPASGPGADFGRFMRDGATLARDQVNAAGGVLGRPVELISEDDQTTNPGAVLAFSRLAARGDIVAFLGPASSTQNHAIAPGVLKAGLPVMFGGTDPLLTRAGNPWLFRCRPNDLYSARAMAEFGAKDLGKRSWAVVYSSDAFGTSGMKTLLAALETLGLKPVLVQAYANQQPDFTPTVLQLRQSGADLIASYFTFPNDLAVFARQLRQLGVATPWIGSPSIVTSSAINLGGQALAGSYGVADFHPAASPQAGDFAERFTRSFGAIPDLFAAWPYDGVMLLARAMAAAGSTDPAAVRTALLAIRDYHGAEGEYRFDAAGDGLRSYNIVRNEGGKIAFVRQIGFSD